MMRKKNFLLGFYTNYKQITIYDCYGLKKMQKKIIC